ncbi:hypothetical protein DH2020_025706 [Rehmannia glutinosa]|uniref:Uncharacterized protein n=1 Tax=Rehmannia glutinosa TaxID=99300 RepID=A0ABR0W2T4_REHGL
MREMERQRSPPQLSSNFNASLPRTVPNWLINGRSSVLDTHAGEDSFELYKHTLLGTDQFALIPFEFTRLEEYIAHNTFSNNALLHHLSLRAANWKRSLDARENEVERLSKALREAEAAKEKLSQENTALVIRARGLEQEVNAARDELKEQKENHESELKETYDTGRKEGYQEYTNSLEYTSALQKAREEGVKSFLTSHSYETLVAHRRSLSISFKVSSDAGTKPYRRMLSRRTLIKINLTASVQMIWRKLMRAKLRRRKDLMSCTMWKRLKKRMSGPILCIRTSLLQNNLHPSLHQANNDDEEE